MQLTKFVLCLLGMIKMSFSEKHCTMSTSKITCTYDPKEDRSLHIQKTDIRTLDLAGTLFIEDSFKDYVNLEELDLSFCWISSLKNGTFSQLPKLKKLNLSNNMLASFNENAFDRKNVLNVLILSDNLLDCLDELHLDDFPKLKVLDISGNRLKYLQGDIIFKIQSDPTFSLYAGNNPWNCSMLQWKYTLLVNEILKNKFCNSTSRSFLGILKYDGKKRRKEGTNLIIRESCGFVKCKWWVIGSVWIGVILGNLNRLNKLLYQSSCRKKRVLEKAVGTEVDVHHLLRQEKVNPTLEEIELKTKN